MAVLRSTFSVAVSLVAGPANAPVAQAALAQAGAILRKALTK